MSIRHHPNDDTIMACAAGALDPALAQVVRLHLTMCPTCNTRYRWSTAVGGALLEDQGGPLTAGQGVEPSLAAARARIAGMAPEAVARPAAAATEPATSALRRILVDAPDRVRWQRISSGIEHYLVDDRCDPAAWVRLFRFQPGVSVPRHAHTGDEYALVLQGAYVDATGRYAPGDFSEADRSLSHAPTVDSEIPCIALIVTTGGVRFEHPLFRAAFRLIGI